MNVLLRGLNELLPCFRHFLGTLLGVQLERPWRNLLDDAPRLRNAGAPLLAAARIAARRLSHRSFGTSRPVEK
jgi:hypothetical protein